MTQSSKYRFVTRRDGFRVEAPDRPPVSVHLCETGFRVHGNAERQLTFFDWIAEDGTPLRDEPDPPDVNLIQYQRLVDVIVDRVMSQWKPPNGRHDFWGVRRWALKKTRHALGGRIHEQWRKLIQRADPNILAVQRAVFSAAFREADLLHSPLLYQDRYLTQDILRYRAAAALVPIVEDLYDSHQRRKTCDRERLMERDEEHLLLDDEEPTHSLNEVIESFSNWQGMCSPTGTRYRSLSRTLMQLPGGVPCSLLYHLSMIRLERPITDRLELATLLLSKAEARENANALDPPMRAFHHATRAEIRDGMTQLAEHLNRPMSHRRTSDIRMFVRYLLDYPDEHRGDLPALVRKSIRWHNVAGWQHRDEFDLEMALDLSTPTRQPPIPLPREPGIRFLASVGEVVSEGERMHHCISSYAHRAVMGHCFLFHVDHEGECASVEIDPAGRVQQSYGPENQANRATKYATSVLSNWARGFPTAGRSYEDLPF